MNDTYASSAAVPASDLAWPTLLDFYWLKCVLNKSLSSKKKPKFDILPLLVNSIKSPDWYIHMSRKPSIGRNVFSERYVYDVLADIKNFHFEGEKAYMVLTEMVVIMLRVTKHR
jgi:hypothetical protein